MEAAGLALPSFAHPAITFSKHLHDRPCATVAARRRAGDMRNSASRLVLRGSRGEVTRTDSQCDAGTDTMLGPLPPPLPASTPPSLTPTYSK